MKAVPSLTHLCLEKLKYQVPPWMPRAIQQENAVLVIQRYWRKYCKSHKVYTDSRFVYIATDMTDWNNDPLYLIVRPDTFFVWYAHEKLAVLPRCRVSKRLVQGLIESVFNKLRL